MPARTSLLGAPASSPAYSSEAWDSRTRRSCRLTPVRRACLTAAGGGRTHAWNAGEDAGAPRMSRCSVGSTQPSSCVSC